MTGVVVESVVERADDGDKEKKRNRRRSSRRSKANSTTSVNSSVNELCGDASDCIQNGRTSNGVITFLSDSASKSHGLHTQTADKHGLTTASDFVVCSMPTMHINEHEEQSEVQGIHDQRHLPSDKIMFSQSFPEPSCEGIFERVKNTQLSTLFKSQGFAKRKLFSSYWSMEEVNESLQKGEVFKAVFRVNAHNRLEAYCKIDGVPIDILISGFPAQNRAVEGDIVVVKVDPLPLWTRMKGSNGISSGSTLSEDVNLLPEINDIAGNGGKGESKAESDYQDSSCRSLLPENGLHFEGKSIPGDYIHPVHNGRAGHNHVNGHSPTGWNNSHVGSSSVKNELVDAVGTICAMISTFPSKRPTGRVVAILERSSRRATVVGFLNVKQWLSFRVGFKKDGTKNRSSLSSSDSGYIELAPTDPRFPNMLLLVKGLPDCIRERLEDGDETVEMELVAAKIDDWGEESLTPEGHILHIFGRGGDVETHINAILFENAICSAEFSPESISCLPCASWEVSEDELRSRLDLRKLCIFTIDPSTATDLDDALSVEKLSNGISRVGVHIADVSHFVLPDTVLDAEAQFRSTSVYLMHRKLQMLPPPLSENFCSLNPGVDRLAFSIFWDINSAGDVIDRWIGRSVIHSCCKLSYEHAQDIIGGEIDVDHPGTPKSVCPQLHGHFERPDVIRSVRSLHEISKILRTKRVTDGALQLESSEVVFSFDEDGIPYDSVICEGKESNFLVEEFMLLANRTAAEVISKCFPDSALLRRHPAPNIRKLREFESFCFKHGLEVDTSSSGQFHLSLERIRQKLKDDSVLLAILISYASRPMQLASYFCSGDLKDGEKEWGHYALAVPLYTHFTSPLRRYPDIVVHRTLSAAIEAEELFSKENKWEEVKKCFTGICFDKDAAESMQGREVLSVAALKHRVPSSELLAEVAAHCNERNLASRHVKDACDKLYMWVLVKKKEILLSEARVMGLGPKFMSIYIPKLAIERRIYYDEVEGLMVEWLEATSTVILRLCANKRPLRRGTLGKYRSVDDFAYVISPYNLKADTDKVGGSVDDEIDPSVSPAIVHLLSTVPVALHAIGGENGPLDIVARLYMSSYFR